jgi:hypothetical protein
MRPPALVLILAAAACGDPTTERPDAADVAADGTPSIDAASPPPDAAVPDAAVPDAAAGPDLSCIGAEPPAVADDPLDITATVFAVAEYQVAAQVGVTVELRARGDGAPLAAATAGEGGDVTLTVPSGGAPVDAFFAIASGAHLPTFAFPARPLVGGERLVADEAELGRWYTDAAAGPFAAGARTAIVAVTDCAGQAIAGATISASAGAVVYYDPDAQRWDPALPSAPNGFALVTGAAASELTITAAAGEVALPPRPVPLAADALTLIVAAP